jgi:hypothetical protein
MKSSAAADDCEHLHVVVAARDYRIAIFGSYYLRLYASVAAGIRLPQP